MVERAPASAEHFPKRRKKMQNLVDFDPSDRKIGAPNVGAYSLGNHPCGHSTAVQGDDMITSFRVECSEYCQNWKKVLGATKFRAIFCPFWYFVDMHMLVPSRWQTELFGPALNDVRPSKPIGELDSGDIRKFVIRVIEGAFLQRPCANCTKDKNQSSMYRAATFIISALLFDDPQPDAVMLLARVENFRDLILAWYRSQIPPSPAVSRRTEADVLIIDSLAAEAALWRWKTVILNLETSGHSIDSLPTLLGGKYRNKELTAEIVRTEIAPWLPRLIQDNFLEVSLFCNHFQPEQTADLSYKNGVWRTSGEPRLESGVVKLPCVYCQECFVAQESTHVHNFSRHYLKKHWGSYLEQRLEDMKTHKARGTILPKNAAGMFRNGDIRGMFQPPAAQ